MERQIYIVNAMTVDANGAFHILDGYPKAFDSQNYSGDTEKTFHRADGDLSETWSAMCKVDTRKIQTVTLSTIDGTLLQTKSMGAF